MDQEKIFLAMERGHKVVKLLLFKKLEPIHKRLSLNRETDQIILSNYQTSVDQKFKNQHLDIRLIHEAETVHYKLHMLQLNDKWKKDKEIQRFDPECLLAISYGSNFVLNHWIILFENKETCKLWDLGLKHVMYENEQSSHAVLVDKWFKKQFYSIASPDTYTVSIKQMKPFIQTVLQHRVESSVLQEIVEDKLDLNMFVRAVYRLCSFTELSENRFSRYTTRHLFTPDVISFHQFHRFMTESQGDEIAQNRDMLSEFLRKYLRKYDLYNYVREPSLTIEGFIGYLYSKENSIFNPANKEVVHDMTRPLAHYWIASSHKTYLTGDQLNTEASLDAYARVLLIGCRCIEVECWDGQKNSTNGEISDISIHNSYNMASKLSLRDVLNIIKHYAFINNDYPVILSIEDNCSVQGQRLMLMEIEVILGDLLLTSPDSREETQLPSPSALRKKIILKHKKLQVAGENIIGTNFDKDSEEIDILQKACNKRGILYLRDYTKNEWTKHVFVLFSDRLCYVLEEVDPNILIEEEKEDARSQVSEEIQDEESSLTGFGIRPEEMHVTEEWFHGKIHRKLSEKRLLEHKHKGNGLFLVRDSIVSIGDYVLSFLYNEKACHCMVENSMVDGKKKYYFSKRVQKDTLYELICYYTKYSLGKH